MSEVFEGIIVKAALQAVEEFFKGHPAADLFTISPLQSGLTVAYLRSPRVPSLTDIEMERLAMELSRKFLVALLVDYDSRASYRAATVYNNGVQREKFGENDEMFVPLNEKGEPILDSRPIKVGEFVQGEEYEATLNSIELGFSSFGDGSWRGFKLFISRH
jgi:hypothetical protein